jgi:hypothetical protein
VKARFAAGLAVVASLFVGLSSRAEGPASAPPPAAKPLIPSCMPPAPVSNSVPPPPPPACFAAAGPDRSCLAPKKTCARDLAIARIAWKYFENNYQAATGMTNAAQSYPSAAMWDLASALGATIAARHLEIIDAKTFDDRIVTLTSTLTTMKLYKDEAPNKAYNTATATMTDYGNHASDGIGFSALDLARLSSWLNILACHHPKHEPAARGVMARWKFDRLVHDGQMWGTFVDPASKTENVAQEGRLGYEQYGGKTFALFGFDQHVAADYKNAFSTITMIYDVPIAYDNRDPRKLGAYNYVVTESYGLDAMEFGLDASNTTLARNIFEVQKRRWQRTNIVTAVSEDNIDRAPHFLYNTIFAAGSAWNTITDTGVDHDKLKSISTKAAFSLATLYPNEPYTAVLLDAVASAYDPDKGWYSGVYEAGLGYNKIFTANTNGIILEAILYKAFGPLNTTCKRCNLGLRFTAPQPACGACRRTAVK